MQPHTGFVEVNGSRIFWETTFDKSINFTCNSCGYCCTNSNVEVSEAEVLQIANLGKADFSESFIADSNIPSIRLKGTDKNPCLFLGKENACSVYAKRPLTCKLYPFKIVPISANHVKIDLTIACPTLLNKEYSENNEVDFGEMIRGYISHPFFGSAENYQGTKLHHAVKDSLDKDTAVDFCWNAVVNELNNLEYAEQLWEVIDSFEKVRERLYPELLKRSNAEKYCSDSLAQFRSLKLSVEPAYSPNIFRGAHTRPYQSLNLESNSVYFFSIKDGVVLFADSFYVKEYPIEKINKKQMSSESKEFLIGYLMEIWKRQTITQKVHMRVYQSLEQKIPIRSFDMQIGIFKKKLMLLQFFMDAIAHHNGHSKIQINDVKESLFPFDLLMLHLA